MVWVRRSYPKQARTMASLPSARLLSSAKPKKESQTGAPPAASAENGGEASKTSLGMRLKRIRTDSGLTLQQVSARTQVARSTLSKIENGQLSPTYDICRRSRAAWRSISWSCQRQ
jgi:DNA-binding XRE family transcriptional regulator